MRMTRCFDCVRVVREPGGPGHTIVTLADTGQPSCGGSLILKVTNNLSQLCKVVPVIRRHTTKVGPTGSECQE